MKHWIIVLSVLALAAAGCVDREAQKQAKRTEALVSDPTVPVSVTPVVRTDVSESLEITGSITTEEVTTIGAKNGGRLVAVYVKDGDTVKAGQLLAQQETTDAMIRVRQQQALVDAARSQVQQAEADARVGPARSAATVRASEARLKQAQANLDKVRAGAREEERTQARWAVENAKKNMEVAKAALDRARRLLSDGATSQAELDRAENAYTGALAAYNNALENQRMIETGARVEDIAAAEQQVAAAREQLASDQAAQRLDVQFEDRLRAARANLRSAEEAVTLARQALTDAKIIAPFAGRVSGKPTQPGTFVGPGSPIVRIVGGESAYFEGDVPEGQIAQLKPRLGVVVQIDALGREFKGTIMAINPLGTDVGRLFKVRVQIEGDTTGLKPGMFARGIVELRRVTDAVVVPDVAIVTQGGERSVFVISNDKAKRVKVTTGLRKNGLVQVEGLSPGQDVVIEGQGKLADGVEVKIEKGEKKSS